MIFNIYIASLLVISFILGVYLIRTDYRIKKIPNKILLEGLKFGFFVHLFLLFLTLLSKEGFLIKYLSAPSINLFILIALNSFFSLLAAYALWNYKIWSAGDAKMFFVFSLLTPVTLIKYVEFPLFPSFSVLINIFLLASIYLLVKSTIYFAKEAFFWLKRPSELGKYFIIVFKKSRGIKLLCVFNFFIALYVFSRLKIYINFFFIDFLNFKWFSNVEDIITIAILLILFPIIKKYLKNKYVFILIFVIFLLVDIYLSSEFVGFVDLIKSTFKIMLIYVVVLGIIEFLTLFYIKNKDIREISLSDLKSGMILCEESISKLQKNEINNKIETLYPDGISDRQIKIIRNYYSSKGINTIKIYTPWSFATWILFGYFFTIIIQQSVITLIKRLI